MNVSGSGKLPHKMDLKYRLLQNYINIHFVIIIIMCRDREDEEVQA